MIRTAVWGGVMSSMVRLLVLSFFMVAVFPIQDAVSGKSTKKAEEQSEEKEKKGCFSFLRRLFHSSPKTIDAEYFPHEELHDVVQTTNDDVVPVDSGSLDTGSSSSSSSSDKPSGSGIVVPSDSFKNKIFKVQPCESECSQKVFVLSLDGGGIRGVILARILMEIERVMRVPIHRLFNLICGSSTGGLVTFALTTPDPEHPGEALYDAEAVLRKYFEKREDIFSKKNILVLPGILESKYKSKGIETFCKQTFTEEARLSELLIPSFVTAFNDTDNVLELFGSHLAFLGIGKNKKVWKAGRMTTAAPYYFSSVQEDGDVYRDGGLAANNPSQVALGEVRRLFPNKKIEDIIVVSIGTGESIGQEIKVDLAIPDIQKIIKQFEEGQLAAVDQTMKSYLGDRYIRLQTKLHDKLQTDNICDQYLETLLSAADQTVIDQQSKIMWLKTLWDEQLRAYGDYKHPSPYEEWRQIQTGVMSKKQMQVADLEKIQEYYLLR